MEPLSITGKKAKQFHHLLFNKFQFNTFSFYEGESEIRTVTTKAHDKIFLSFLFRAGLVTRPSRGHYRFITRPDNSIDYDKMAYNVGRQAHNPRKNKFKVTSNDNHITEDTAISFLKSFGDKYKILVKQAEYKEA